MATRVLLAIDESDASRRAALVARSLFGVSAEYLAVNVSRLAIPWVVAGVGYGGVASFPVDGFDERLGLATREVETIARDVGIVDVEVIAEVGDPVDRICAAATEHAVNVIVVGAHDRNFLQRLFEPSVSAGVLSGTDIPVLVVRERD